MKNRCLVFLVFLLFLALPAVSRAGSDTVSALDYGARCDGKTDDTAAFQRAVDDSAMHGTQLTFRGVCHVAALAVPDGAASFSLDGRGNTLVFSKGGLSLRNSGSGKATLYEIRNLRIETVSKSAAVALRLEGNVKGGIDALTVEGFGTGIAIRNASDARIARSFFRSPAGGRAISIAGTLDSTRKPVAFASNNDVTDVTVLHGTGVFLGPAVQGTKIRNLRVLEAQYGVFAESGPGDEDLSISESYLEGRKAGIFADGLPFLRIVDSSADLPGSGADAHWAAFHLAGMFGGILSGSNVWGASAAHSPVIVAGGNIAITGNQITGLTGGPCMALSPHTDRSRPPMLVADNTCWAAGGYRLMNEGGILGAHNLWSGTDNHSWKSVDFSPAD